MIHHPSTQYVANHLKAIKLLLKKVHFFVGDHITQKMTTSNETQLTLVIVDLIIYEGLYFNLSQKPRFKKVLGLSIYVSKIYQPPVATQRVATEGVGDGGGGVDGVSGGANGGCGGGGSPGGSGGVAGGGGEVGGRGGGMLHRP